MMASPIVEIDISPSPRTKEENQERAFIAASRRKDRSLDARVESANRASSLHKQRTGKALLINRDIVEREAMYEEVDDRYQEKINRIMHAQSLQMNNDFNRNLMAVLHASRPSALHQRRATNAHLNPRASANGIRKMSLDLTGLRASMSEGMHTGPMTSPLEVQQSPYVLSPTYHGSSQSPSYPNVVPASSGHLPSYLTQTAGGPTWPTQMGGGPSVQSPWTAGFVSPAQQGPNGLGDLSAMPVRQFRDRMGSAPVIPMRTVPSPSMATPAGTNPTSTATVTPSTPATRPASSMFQHARVRSEPTPGSRTQSLANLSQMHSLGGLPMEAMEPIPTPDLCPTPSTPQSPTSMGQTGGLWGLQLHKDEGLGYPPEHHLDPEYEDFSHYAIGLGSEGPLVESDMATFDDYLTMEEFTVSV
ncbi:hypothetical protein BO70DRAFT_318432 [Aspergillus heteromorphus CBS 117.55]|uniref:Uncharacterized protein n=1 Tax=Aspergillus heteromorphus CBS 117.55 TaxID=1448321 RepID=A0A317VPE1_9EURO|nr:uncharacterized protein BO70DRAFT_318432 [Aspergillus heteromorphus CBS 117.55]PWY76254.1 hypothetical protein BO70DRAFT_318432 [Aspergillus heteromorphus CBS 117.55]